jgi:predicted membrane protein
MFLATIIFAIGLFLLLNGLGIVSGNFAGLFFGILFIIIGLKMLMKKKICPWCDFRGAGIKFHEKFHDHCHCEDENCPSKEK